MVRILDASALLAYLEKEPGYEKVKDFFVKAIESDRNLLITTVNWGEVCYILQRDYLDRVEEILKLIKTFPLVLFIFVFSVRYIVPFPVIERLLQDISR